MDDGHSSSVSATDADFDDETAALDGVSAIAVVPASGCY